MIPFNNILLYTVSFFGLYTAIFYLLTLYENWGRTRSKTQRKDWPKVSVIVPCYNEEKGIEKTLRSLLALDYPKQNLDIVVVDDGSNDKTYQKALKFKKRGVRVFRKKNGGKHTALNLGLTKTKHPFVGGLDADSMVDSQALKRLVSRFDDDQVMAVTPSMKIINPKGILRRIQSIEFTIGIFLRRVFADLGAQHVTPGPFTIYRREFFDKYGAYRAAHKTEDIEIALRIQSKQFQVENATDAFVYTHGPGTFRSLHKQRIRWYYGFLSNVIDYKHLFGKKHGNLGLFVLPTALLSVILVIVSAVYILFKTLDTAWQNFTYYSAVGFDIWKMLDPSFNPFFINTSPVMIISLVSLIVGLALFFISRATAQDKEPWKFSYICFFLFYWVLFGFWWLVAGFYRLFHHEVAWGHKSEVGV